MRNVTITLDEDVARWARMRAAERETSVSRLVGEMLRDKMITEEGYRAAREQFFSIRPRRMRKPGRPLPTRDELHDRAGLR
jgi:plasmid stability protein